MPDISSVGAGSVSPVERNAVGSHRFHSNLGESANGVSPRRADRVELSEHARLLDRLRQLPPARFDRVDRVRIEIENGTYESETKLDTAIRRLIDDLID